MFSEVDAVVLFTICRNPIDRILSKNGDLLLTATTAGTQTTKKYITDGFTSILELRWRWIFVAFLLSYLFSWICKKSLFNAYDNLGFVFALLSFQFSLYFGGLLHIYVVILKMSAILHGILACRMLMASLQLFCSV